MFLHVQAFTSSGTKKGEIIFGQCCCTAEEQEQYHWHKSGHKLKGKSWIFFQNYQLMLVCDLYLRLVCKESVIAWDIIFGTFYINQVVYYPFFLIQTLRGTK